MTSPFAALIPLQHIVAFGMALGLAFDQNLVAHDLAVVHLTCFTTLTRSAYFFDLGRGDGDLLGLEVNLNDRSNPCEATSS